MSDSKPNLNDLRIDRRPDGPGPGGGRIIIISPVLLLRGVATTIWTGIGPGRSTTKPRRDDEQQND